ncbi:hypothetical protein DRO26_03595, partial [Candidatus Bathyarchaeota archaeon]
ANLTCHKCKNKLPFDFQKKLGELNAFLEGKVDVFGGEAICPYCGASIPYHVRVGRPKYQNLNV